MSRPAQWCSANSSQALHSHRDWRDVDRVRPVGYRRGERQQGMSGYFIFFGGILLFVTVVLALDAIGRRQQRKAGKG
jgi:hypothetical protein